MCPKVYNNCRIISLLISIGLLLFRSTVHPPKTYSRFALQSFHAKVMSVLNIDAMCGTLFGNFQNHENARVDCK